MSSRNCIENSKPPCTAPKDNRIFVSLTLGIVTPHRSINIIVSTTFPWATDQARCHLERDLLPARPGGGSREGDGEASARKHAGKPLTASAHPRLLRKPTRSQVVAT